eukprot:CAMPEP_0184428482 /NCGR_PEP_ID=MMETSP0738-20130409/210823_1 /TAXON_ID=385413 /ORGANISM="Thalassiosira miniscula, Strain CCMP1093" /LENGTH=108 /DNA_ID=CAMNT_0026792405 /DNA_START=112 /DNA_END=435 /DNA_ORIENTATION=-
MDNVATIFDRYEAVRHRLPSAEFPSGTRTISSLQDIADQADAFVFDAYGVLNIGESAIPGASERLSGLRRSGHQVRILSNAASYNHEGALTKFQKLAMHVRSDEIVTK